MIWKFFGSPSLICTFQQQNLIHAMWGFFVDHRLGVTKKMSRKSFRNSWTLVGFHENPYTDDILNMSLNMYVWMCYFVKNYLDYAIDPVSNSANIFF